MVGSFVDMALTPEESEELNGFPTPSAKLPKYPYGLCISLCNDELEKLGIEVSDLGLGDFLHLHSLAKVTSISCNDTESGSTCRVELVLAFIDCEDEGMEDEEEDKPSMMKRLYR